MLGAMSVDKSKTETTGVPAEPPAAPDNGAGEAKLAGEIARMSPEQLAKYERASANAREIAYAHSRAERQREQAHKKARGAQALADQAAKSAEKAAERANEADQIVQQTAQAILQEMGVFKPGAKLEIGENGVIIDVEARLKQQNGQTN